MLSTPARVTIHVNIFERYADFSSFFPSDPDQGNLPMAQINQQITVLNQHFRNSQLTFQLVDVTRTQNQQWFDDAADDGSGGLDSEFQIAMKKALHVGDASTLNVRSRSLF